MSDTFDEFLDPKKIFDNLMKSCRELKFWNIRCIVDEAYCVALGELPFKVIIIDGIYYCTVISEKRTEAMKKICDHLPVIKFLDNEQED